MSSTLIRSSKPKKPETDQSPQSLAGPVVAGEHTEKSFPHQGETPATLVAPDAVKGAVAPRNPLNCSKIPCREQAMSQPGSGSDGVGVAPSIETRLAALQEKLSASGKIKRIKSSTPREYARLPHAND